MGRNSKKKGRTHQGWPREANDERKRLEKLKKPIIQALGKNVRELAGDEAYNTVSKTRTVSLNHTLGETRAIMHRTILARINRAANRKTALVCKPRSIGYVAAEVRMETQKDWDMTG